MLGDMDDDVFDYQLKDVNGNTITGVWTDHKTKTITMVVPQKEKK